MAQVFLIVILVRSVEEKLGPKLHVTFWPQIKEERKTEFGDSSQENVAGINLLGGQQYNAKCLCPLSLLICLAARKHSNEKKNLCFRLTCFTLYWPRKRMPE
jgi:hypothetical protein